LEARVEEGPKSEEMASRIRMDGPLDIEEPRPTDPNRPKMPLIAAVGELGWWGATWSTCLGLSADIRGLAWRLVWGLLGRVWDVRGSCTWGLHPRAKGLWERGELLAPPVSDNTGMEG
jgi:alkylation response protein AidB-like acyl-CoA dehydrogenase